MKNIKELNLYDYQSLSIEEIEEIERKLNIKLPPLYIDFISKYNHARFSNKDIFIYNENKGYKIEDKEKLEYNGFKLNYFLDFKNIETDIGYTFSNTELNSKELIPIIYDSGGSHFFLCCKEGEHYGKIFYDYVQTGYTIETLYYVADNIEEFLDCIVDEETYENTPYD